MTLNILAVSGSLRAASSNTGLLRMAQRVAPDGIQVSDPYPIHELPFYDEDLDTPDTLPAVVAAWRSACTAADGLLLAAPEYNWSTSAVMKNALDWALRPFGRHALVGTVTSVMTSAGKGAGSKVQEYLVNFLPLIGVPIVNSPVVAIPMGMTIISADGSTTDPAIEQLVSARLIAMQVAIHAARQAAIEAAAQAAESAAGAN